MRHSLPLVTPTKTGLTTCIMAFTLGLPLAGCGVASDTGERPDAAEDAEPNEDVASAESALDGACAHDKCTQGAVLDAACSAAAGSICAADPYCCDVYWDGICVSEVQSVTNSLVCAASSGSCEHTLCSQ